MKLIDKDALVVEIDRQIELLKPFLGACAGQIVAEANDKLSVLEELKNFLDTLEVKEVDFEHELSKYVSKGIHRFFPNEGDNYYNMDSVVWQDYVIETAKHFFELGLSVNIKAQKGE